MKPSLSQPTLVKTGHRRLERPGRIVTDADGCTSLEVGVPCAGCATRCGSPRQPQRLPLTSFSPGTGDHAVQLSVSARGLNAAVLGVFGPALLVFGALAVVAPRWPALAALLGASGLPLALGLGHRLAGRGAALLDVRTRPLSVGGVPTRVVAVDP